MVANRAAIPVKVASRVRNRNRVRADRLIRVASRAANKVVVSKVAVPGVVNRVADEVSKEVVADKVASKAVVARVVSKVQAKLVSDRASTSPVVQVARADNPASNTSLAAS